MSTEANLHKMDIIVAFKAQPDICTELNINIKFNVERYQLHS